MLARRCLLEDLRLLNGSLTVMALQDLCNHVHHHAAHTDVSWKNIGFKDLSNHGFDTANRGLMIVDYGNHAYTVLLFLLADLYPNTWGAAVEYLALWWHTLSIHHPDSDHAWNMKGDVIEMLLGGLRGAGEHIYLSSKLCKGDIELYNALCRVSVTIKKLLILVLGEKGPEGQRRHGELSRYGLISSQRTQEWQAFPAQQQATEIRMYLTLF